MESLERAVLRTVLYGDVFNFAMTPREIHHFLVHDAPVPLAAVERVLDRGNPAAGYIETRDGYAFRAGRRDLAALRAEREAASAYLMPLALRYGRWLARLPFVRMVALTGALAMQNAASADDDVDYLLVTAPGRVWLARAFSIVLVRLAKLRGVVICPNYVLAETALEQDRQDLFIAHELAQMLPVYGGAVYARIRAANGWTADFLPNAAVPFHSVEPQQPGAVWGALKRAAEFLLGGRLGDWLEAWERDRKLRRFAADMQTPHHAARLDSDHVKGHFDDHGHRVLAAYRERLAACGIAEAAAGVAGPGAARSGRFAQD